MITDKEVNEAVLASISKQILEGLNTSARDAILAKSISAALTDYSFKEAIKNTVAQKAIEAAEIILKSDKMRDEIIDAVEVGIESLMKKLPEAVELALIEAILGIEGNDSYSKRPSLILKHLKMGPDDE